MNKNNYYTGIELTSQSIKLIVGSEINGKIYVLDTLEKACSGLNNGLIISSDEVTKCLNEIVLEASKKLNINPQIKDVSLILPPFSLACATDSGSTTTISSDDIVGHVDTMNIIAQIKKRNFKEEDLKIVDIVPDSYLIDNNERYDTEPIGKTSEALSLHASIYAMSAKVFQQFCACIKKANLNLRYSTISPYAISLYLSTFDGMPPSYLLIDIGHSLTTISHIQQGKTIIKSSMMRFGGKDISQFVADKFKISFNEAEEIKVKYGLEHDPNFKVYIKNDITFDKLSDAIATCLTPALDEIKKIIEEFSIDDNNQLPIVLCGGTSQLNHIDNIIADELDRKIINYQIPTLGARDKGLLAVLGIIKYWSEQPRIDEEDKITASVTRVDSKKNSKFNITEEL